MRKSIKRLDADHCIRCGGRKAKGTKSSYCASCFKIMLERKLEDER